MGESRVVSRRRRASVVVAVLALVALAASCGDDDDAAPGTTGPQPTGTEPTAPGAPPEECTADLVGGTVTMGVFSEAQGLDPAAAPGAGSTGGSERAALFDTLVRYNADTGEFEPHVAESVTPNGDHTEWTVTIRDGVTFGNGDPLTAEAVKHSLERHGADTARSSVRRVLAGATVTVADERTVVIAIAEPWVGFPFVLAREGGMITNPAVVEADPDGFAQNPRGAGVGPFELVRYAPGEVIVLSARDDYWAGPVCIEELRFVHRGGSDATLDALTVDDIEVGFLSSPAAVDRAVRQGLPGFDNLVHYAEGVLLNNGLRGSEAATTDERLRRAISLAIDPDVIDSRVWDGVGMPTKAVVHPGSRLAPQVAEPPTDPDEAARLVAELKAEGWDGRLRLICNDAPDRVEASLAIDAMLRAVGIDVELDNRLDIPQLISTVLVDANFDAACWGQGAFESGLWFTYNTFHSQSPANQTGYGTPEMDAALDALAVAGTPEELQAAVTRMQDVWNDTVPSIIYGASNYRITHADRLHGLRMNTSAIVMFDKAFLQG